MKANVLALPYELLSSILEETATANARDIQNYTYGVDTTSNGKGQRILRGQVAPDALRWLSTDAFRHVNRQWHDWAVQYALRDLYIRRWRGSERWIQSRNLHNVHFFPSRDVVYRDPYCSLRKTLRIFARYPVLASSVRKIFFDGYYGVETGSMIFQILRHCDALDNVSLPWTVLRYGSEEDWANLLRQRENGTALSSLELLAVDLKHVQITDCGRQIDQKPLNSPKVDLGQLRRIKLTGTSNLMPIDDDDLAAVSQTAELDEIHITGTTAVTTKGLTALVRTSRNTLRVIEHSPLSDDGFTHPDAVAADIGSHLCEEIINCPHLSTLAITLPTICLDLFSDPSIKWAGDVQIRAAGICNLGNLEHSPDARRAFFDVLSRARSLVEAQAAKDIELKIEIYIHHLIFEPAKSLVHADLSLGRVLSAGTWPLWQEPSSKGPYGQTGQYGKEEQAYSCISESAFAVGLEKGYISY
ncbi:MAG: hypothetical protein Q9219_002056 [cf. Caloplaca sp. 3 TL-2023]